MTPIAPHWAEEVWGIKLQRPGCAITAGWPVAAEPDFALQVPSNALGAREGLLLLPPPLYG